MALGSNHVRPKQIGRSWGFGCAGRRRATAGDESRSGAAQGSPEFTKSGAPGIASTRAWVGCVQRVTRDAPGQKQGTAGLCSPGMAAAVELADAARAGCACARLWALRGQGGST
jgi:hypothetical protein